MSHSVIACSCFVIIVFLSGSLAGQKRIAMSSPAPDAPQTALHDATPEMVVTLLSTCDDEEVAEAMRISPTTLLDRLHLDEPWVT